MSLEWQPIETAPKDGTPVLLYRAVDEYGYGGMMVGSWFAEVEHWNPEHISGYEWECDLENPTHWMPLPEPPK